MSRTAQGVIAVKQCRFPPVFGYKIEVLDGAVTTLSTANFASLTVKGKVHIKLGLSYKEENLWYMCVKHRLAARYKVYREVLQQATLQYLIF